MEFDPQAIFSTLKSISDISNQFLTIKNIPAKVVGELQSKILELQGQAIAANSRIMSLTDEKATLEAENNRLKDWTEEKSRYELRKIGSGITVYCLQENEVSDSEPQHSLCPKCYSEGTKSFIQMTDLGHLQQLKCPVCGEMASSTFNIQLP